MKRSRTGLGRSRSARPAAPAGVRLALAVALLLGGLALHGPAAAQSTAAPEEAPDVSVAREHMFLTRGPSGLHVLHLLELVNLGPRQAERVPLPVPVGAQWEQVPQPVTSAEDGLVDPRPLSVGERREYALAYTLPWREPMVLRRALLYPTEELWIWAEAGSVGVRGLRLEPVGRQAVEDMEFVLYRMNRLEPHPAWQVVLDLPGARTAHLPVLARGGMRGDPAEVLAQHPVPRLALVALVLAGAVWGVRRLRTGVHPAGAAADPVSRRAAVSVAAGAGELLAEGPAVRGEIERLKDEIVRLDVAYHNGEVDEDVYRERRAALKARVLQLLGNGGATGP